MKLLYAPGTCALAVHITLEWIGEPYELEEVKQTDPEFLKLNPLGQVPVAFDQDGKMMNQADAILKYLAHKHPKTKLGDNGTVQDAYELDHWLAFLTGDVHPAFYPYFMPQRYSTDNSEEAKKATKEASYKLIDRVYQHLDQHFQDTNYLVGDRRTIADAYAFAMVRWGNKLPKPLADYPNLNRFYQYWSEDKGVQQAMQQQGIE